MLTKRQFIEDAKKRGITDPATIEAKSKQFIEQYGDFKQEEKTIPKTPEQLKSLINDEKRKTYQDMSFGDRAIAGAGKVAYSTLMAPVERFILGKGKKVSENNKEYALASQDDLASRLGEIGSDLALLALPVGSAVKTVKYGSKLAQVGLKGLAAGLTSAGMHEGQRIAMGEDSRPIEGVTEVAGSIILPMGTTKIAQYLKKAAPRILQSALKPPVKYSRQINRPQFEVPLEQGLATNFGGVEALHRNVSNKVEKVGNVFKNVVAQSDAKVNHDAVMLETQKQLSKSIGYKGFTVKDYDEAMKVSEDAIQTALRDAVIEGEGPMMLDALSALKLQRNAGPKGNWSAFSADVKTPNEAKFWETYNRTMSKKLDEAIEKQGKSDVLQSYRIAKKELAKLVPIEKTVRNAVNRIGNNFKPGLLDLNAGGLGANIAGGAGAMGAMGARRTLSTVGGANMMYGAGKLLEKESPVMSQLIRSGSFNE